MKGTLIIGNYNYSSWSLRAWLVARWSGLEFEEQRLALDTDQFPDEVQALSPSGLVPVLHHDEKVVWDSLAIAEYLAERFPQARLWPAAETMRVTARSLSAEMHGGFTSLRSQMPMNCRASGRKVMGDAALARDIQRITLAWSEALRISGGPCLFGARCIA
ncbi:MAG: glutathione S-transferase N-terminal domain-containing protein, partial [Gammaproteobacteria bacterium]|nr:glutathione S-transferase N-terminal domain-containing protein [Gammaproteobacteria bacterium]